MAITPFIPPSFLTSLPTGIWSGADGLPVLPYLPGQSVTVTKAPKWSTGVIRAASGRERRTAYWSFPLWQFELQYEVIRHRPTTPELATMWEFFNVMQGQFGPWLFVDPSACQILTSILLDGSGHDHRGQHRRGDHRRDQHLDRRSDLPRAGRQQGQYRADPRHDQRHAGEWVDLGDKLGRVRRGERDDGVPGLGGPRRLQRPAPVQQHRGTRRCVCAHIQWHDADLDG
jgi:hypothetical protein